MWCTRRIFREADHCFCGLILLFILYGRGTMQQENPLQCGIRQIRQTTLIVQGYNAVPGAWPWHTAVFLKNAGSITYACGGTLISEQYVLTAAHCVIDQSNKFQLTKNRIFLRFGVHNLDVIDGNTFQQHKIEKINIHENYTIDSKNDIAILELATVAKFTDHVQPACLSTSSDLTGQYGTAIGWGVTEDDNTSVILKSAQMPVIGSITCLESNPVLFKRLLDEGTFCAGYTNGTSVCNGDSGGGLFFNESNAWYLGGIVSRTQLREGSNNICKTNGFAAFTKVFYYLPWISSVTNLTFSGSGQRCSINQFTCSDDTCIDGYRRCDRHRDCRDRSDENECETYYCPNEHRCPGGACIENSQVCDGIRNCHDGSDEFNCGSEIMSVDPSETYNDKLPLNCGIYNTNRTSREDATTANVFEFPWVAMLIDNRNDYGYPICMATVISKRYILTSAWCIVRQPVKVLLGDHTLEQDIDCNVVDGYRDCALPAREYEIEFTIKHPDHDFPIDEHNIGLIRLNRDVQFDDHIQPICLPATDSLRQSNPQKFIVTGWWHYQSSGPRYLHKDIVTPTDRTLCEQGEKLSSNQLCVRHELDQNHVYIQGGPLGYTARYNGNTRFVQFGIILGYTAPEPRSWYTNLAPNMDWIVSNMKP